MSSMDMLNDTVDVSCRATSDERRFLGGDTARLRDLLERLALDAAIRRVKRHHQRRRAASAPDVLGHERQEGCALPGIGEPLGQRLPSAGLRLARDERGEQARARRLVRILIGPDRHAAGAGGVDVRRALAGAAPGIRAERLHVRDDAGRARTLGDGDDFVDGGQDADRVRAFVTDVTRVHGAAARGLCRRAHQVGHFVGLRVGAGRVEQAAGETERTVAHRHAHRLAHPLPLDGCRRAAPRRPSRCREWRHDRRAARRSRRSRACACARAAPRGPPARRRRD